MLESFFLILVLAFICGYIDTALGMGYGTILSPLLIILGFNPLIVIPSILLSHAVAGISATVFHSKYKNIELKKGSRDLRIVLMISLFGVIATIIAALIAINIPVHLLKAYIGMVVLIMGIILVSRIKFKFSWRKILGLSIFSAFNKSLSGGGFGPIVTSGQIIVRKRYRNAIACTILAKVPVSLAGFLTYLLVNGMENWSLIPPLLIGFIAVTPLGALTTRKIEPTKLRTIIGIVIIIFGAWILRGFLNA